MANPDRAEFRYNLHQHLKKPEQNRYITRWLRAPIFAARTSLAILTATPGMIIATDTINGIENSPIVYDSGQKVTMYSQYDFDQPLTPTATAQSPEVHKLYLNSHHYVIRGFRDEPNFRGDFPIDRSRTIDAGIANRNVFPIDESRMIGNWGGTHIFVKVGQTLEISATGRMLLNEFRERFQRLYDKSCNGSTLFDPDGNRYWNDKVCPPTEKDHTMLRAAIGGGYGSERSIPIGSYWKGNVDRGGMLILWIYTGNLYNISGGFDVTVTVYPLPPTPTSVPPPRPTSAPEAVRTITPPEKGSDLPSWLLGLGAAGAGLAAFWGYERRKRKNPTSPPPPPPRPSPPLPSPGSRGPNPNTSPNRAPNLGPNAAGGNPNTSPNTAPSTGPSQPKNPEWIIGQKEFARRWQEVKSKLPPVRAGDTGNEQGYILDRFKAGISIVHEVSLEDATNVPEIDTRLRAGIEYLTAEIWPDKRIFRRFFDPNFNAGLLTPEDLAKIIYLPEKYHHLSVFTRAQRRDIMTIRSTLLHALHPDLLKTDSDPNLKDSMDLLLKQLNAVWPLINKLIS